METEVSRRTEQNRKAELCLMIEMWNIITRKIEGKVIRKFVALLQVWASDALRIKKEKMKTDTALEGKTDVKK